MSDEAQSPLGRRRLLMTLVPTAEDPLVLTRMVLEAADDPS